MLLSKLVVWITLWIAALGGSAVEEPRLLLQPPAENKVLVNNYHIYQTFNNCGPAALSMALSYYGKSVSQQELGQELRPYQHPKGNNDDKSVTLAEMAKKAEEYDLVPFHRPNGNIETIRQFVSHDMPVITRTWLKENDDIGHFRVIKGYDDGTGQLIQDDSLQGRDLKYSYSVFNNLWKKLNYEYLVLVPKDKLAIAETILGEDKDPVKAWEKALQNSQNELRNNPDDIHARLNASIAWYNLGNYQKAISVFEKIEAKLPFRTLWYQIEPIQAYFAAGDYSKVFSITDKILNNGNRAFSELYLIRGEIYLKQGRADLAKQEFENAVFYNKNLENAKEAWETI